MVMLAPSRSLESTASRRLKLPRLSIDASRALRGNTHERDGGLMLLVAGARPGSTTTSLGYTGMIHIDDNKYGLNNNKQNS